ncbi:MAG: hypothetical protein NW214_14600 [Pseudanabaenaceae cyanobacterium bins.39]|nr:hypothetical protein [Pseudanabaenaceae cyanobacterium bins.39]
MTIIILVNFKLFKIVRYPVKQSPIPQIKERSPLNPQNPITNLIKIKLRSPHTAHKPDRLFPQIKQRSPLNTHKCDRLNLKIKQRSPYTSQKLCLHFSDKPRWFLHFTITPRHFP